MNRSRILVALGVILFSAPVFADPATVIWLTSDQAPQFILSGSDKGLGAIDGVMAYLQSRLPEFSHSTSVNNIQRTMTYLQADGPYLAIGLVKTPEREKSVLFSEPFSVAFPAGILLRRVALDQIQPYIASDGSLDLEPFLASGRFSVGVAAGRSYGAATDEVLARHQGQGVVDTRFAENGIMAGLVQMLLQNRVDAVFAYRSEVRYVIRDEAQLKSLVVLTVKPAGNPVTIHAAVPRTAWGRALLDRLNPLLLKARVDPEFRAMSDRWTDDESRALILKVFKGS